MTCARVGSLTRSAGMRIVPVIGLLAGCNWVFGLADTGPVIPDGTAPTHVLLTRQVLSAPGMDPDLLPIGSTQFSVSLLDQPTELATVDVDDRGGFDLPDAVIGHPYRVIYELPEDKIPREIVWPQGTHYVVPIFGRVDRGPAPNATVTYGAVGGSAPPGFFDPSVITTGLWSVEPHLATTNPAIDDYLKSTALGGPLGTLASGSDAIWIIDYQCVTQDCMMTTFGRGLPNHAIGFAKTSFDLKSGSNAISAVWTVPTSAANGRVMFDDSFMRERLSQGVVGHASGTTTLMSTGVIPSFSMPASTSLREDGGIADPVMIPLANSSDGMMDDSINPFVLSDALPAAVAGSWTNTRSVNSTALTSGYIQVQAPEGTPPTTLEPCVDLASAVTIHDPSTVADPVLLENDSSILPFIGTAPQLEVTFAINDDATKKPMSCAAKNIVTQACSVTVFELDASGLLHTKRVVDAVVTPPTATVEIDTSAFEVDHDFVLGIVCRAGYDPGAFAQGRFDAVVYPFSTSTHYPASFHTMTPP